MATASALVPLAAAAQENGPPPSGAAVEVGGIQRTGDAPQATSPSTANLGESRTAAPDTANLGVTQGAAPGNTANAGAARVSNAPATVAGAQQARPVVLPNTGAGPATDDGAGRLMVGGLIIVVAGLSMRRRASSVRPGA
jgi:hypothetical protein